jgi:hypothetical protein
MATLSETLAAINLGVNELLVCRDDLPTLDRITSSLTPEQVTEMLAGIDARYSAALASLGTVDIPATTPDPPPEEPAP